MLDIFSIHMTELEKDRMIRVYLPKQYNEEDKQYPVLYMHDGKNIFQDEGAIGGLSLGLENYLDEINVETIVVGIDANLNEERVNEYSPWINGEFGKRIIGHQGSRGGKGEAYLDFLVHDLKPLIDKKYRTRENRSYIAGISLGGLISTYAACRYPDIFTRVAAISSAFYINQEEIEKYLKQSNLTSIERFYLDCGTDEAGENKGLSKEFLISNKAVYDILSEKITNMRFEVVDGAEHDYEYFRERVPEIISYLVK